VQWSPLGTYLATIHRQGAAVWGGEKTFNRLMRYIHPQVCIHQFVVLNCSSSPEEGRTLHCSPITHKFGLAHLVESNSEGEPP
jgi:hypothetical protein